MPDIDFRFALLGHPLGHTLSPVIHNTAFEALGIDERYGTLDVRPEDLPELMKGLGDSGMQGLNVTVPHKESVIPFLDSVSEAAGRIGAVNTIDIREGRLHGHNTDHAGFRAALPQDPTGPALILGAGGAARAVLYALDDTRGGWVAARRSGQAARLIETVSRAPEMWNVCDWAGRIEVAQSASLIVNTTPIGMWPDTQRTPLPGGMLHEGQTAYDLVYNPEETLLLKDARAAGARVIGGLPMLVGQAAAAFEIWTGRPLPLDPVHTALKTKLGIAS